MLRVASGLAALTLCLGQSAWACEGDLDGYWQKRPPGSGGAFEVIEAFKIDTATGQLSVCGGGPAFGSDYQRDGGRMKFGYKRRMRVLTQDASGAFLSPSWRAEFRGVTSEYRIRVVE